MLKVEEIYVSSENYIKRDALIESLLEMRLNYLHYRGSSFDKNTGELLWAKDDALSYAEAIDDVINFIKDL